MPELILVLPVQDRSSVAVLLLEHASQVHWLKTSIRGPYGKQNSQYRKQSRSNNRKG